MRRFEIEPYYTRHEPSFGDALARAFELAQRVARDEIRLLQLESQEKVQHAARRGGLLAFGGLCLLVAWLAACGAAIVALAPFVPDLAQRLGILAGVQLVLAAIVIAVALRQRDPA
jgi:hypothetical protein